MNSISIQETGSHITLRAMHQTDGSITMDVGLDNPIKITHIISLTPDQINKLIKFLQNVK